MLAFVQIHRLISSTQVVPESNKLLLFKREKITSVFHPMVRKGRYWKNQAG